MADATREVLREQLRALGVSAGQTVVVHSSYRAIRPVQGGPEVVLDALLEAVGPTGTLTMPSWTDDADHPFDPRSTSSLHLGVLTELFWRRPGVLRNGHPEAFAAIGPRARELLRDPLPLPPHLPASPIGRVHDADGWVLLLGVGHDSNTTLHLAELLAHVPYGIPKTVTVVRDGSPVSVNYRENDHCCARFEQMDALLRAGGLQREGRVGNAQARFIRSRDVVQTALELLRANPTAFLHPRSAGCAECDEAWASIGT